MMIPTFTGVSLLEIHTKMFCKMNGYWIHEINSCVCEVWNKSFILINIRRNIRSIDGDTPVGIACVLRLQAQAMPAARELVNTKYC